MRCALNLKSFGKLIFVVLICSWFIQIITVFISAANSDTPNAESDFAITVIDEQLMGEQFNRIQNSDFIDPREEERISELIRKTNIKRLSSSRFYKLVLRSVMSS